jgi:hypothetical protein
MMRRWLLTGSIVLLGFFVLCWWWLRPTTPQMVAVLTLGASSDSSYALMGSPTISADFINQVLAAYHSPASGKGQALYDLGVKYGIDPVYALAFFWHESDFGTTGEARVTRSLGNERCITDRPCIDRDRGGYALMNSWEDGFEHWYALIRYGYVEGQVTIPIVGHVCTTIDQIVPVYAPSQDRNDVAAYIQAVKHAVDTWRSGQVWV